MMRSSGNGCRFMFFTLLSAFATSAWGQWTQSEALRHQKEFRSKSEPLRATVNLDLAPKKRWEFLGSDPAFAGFKSAYQGYISTYVPKSVLPLVTSITKQLRYTYYRDYAEEMEGIADALGVSLGDVVLINLIYQVEHLGVSCKARNTTGPCPPHEERGPGLCTGLVVNNANGDGPVFQGRNLDWNLDASLLRFIMQVNYERGGKTIFTGVQIVGMVGCLHGLRNGIFSVQLNARLEGGEILPNILEQILLGGKTPTHVIRKALETSENYKAAEDLLSKERLSNPGYLIMAGANHGEGVILTRDRNRLADAWRLDEVPSKDVKGINRQPDWLRLQTNYDHWTPAPSFDDRRTPGVANAVKLCSAGVNEKTVLDVMTQWPTQNHHTDVTSIMCPLTGYFETIVWTPAVNEIMV